MGRGKKEETYKPIYAIDGKKKGLKERRRTQKEMPTQRR